MTPDCLQSLRVGFMPLLDCATLVVAREAGFAAQEGIDLKLERETSWANIRDRVGVGHLDAAQMLAPMVVASRLGLLPLDAPFVAPVALGRGGNAITVSGALWSLMSAQGASLGAPPAVQGRALARVVANRLRRREPVLTFAMVFPYSCHNYLLRAWLQGAGLDPDADLRIVVLPPPLLVDALRSGQVDGFCVGDPWGSLAVGAGLGCIVATTRQLAPDAPEKVLGLREDWALRHPAQVSALVRAIRRAARWCDNPLNLERLAGWLSEPRFVGVPAAVLCGALAGRMAFAQGEPALAAPGFIEFARAGADEPLPMHAHWILAQMQGCGQAGWDPDLPRRAASGLRGDLYAAAGPID